MYLIRSSSVSVLIVPKPILDILVASLPSLTLPRQQISPKTLSDLTGSATDLLWTDTERVCGLKKHSENQSFVQSFHLQTCPWQSIADPWQFRKSFTSPTHIPCQLPYMELWHISVGDPWMCNWPLKEAL